MQKRCVGETKAQEKGKAARGELGRTGRKLPRPFTLGTSCLQRRAQQVCRESKTEAEERTYTHTPMHKNETNKGRRSVGYVQSPPSAFCLSQNIFYCAPPRPRQPEAAKQDYFVCMCVGQGRNMSSMPEDLPSIPPSPNNISAILSPAPQNVCKNSFSC